VKPDDDTLAISTSATTPPSSPTSSDRARRAATSPFSRTSKPGEGQGDEQAATPTPIHSSGPSISWNTATNTQRIEILHLLSSSGLAAQHGEVGRLQRRPPSSPR
jgi:hypothetical protein